MIATRQPLQDKSQTAKKMYSIVRDTANDLKNVKICGTPAANLCLKDFFQYVRTIPYRRDPRPREIIARPKHLLKYRESGLDCKKKAILMGTWATVNNIPFRFVATSKTPDKRIHHVFPQLLISGRFIDTDATYPTNRINAKKQYTKMVILPRGNL